MSRIMNLLKKTETLPEEKPKSKPSGSVIAETLKKSRVDIEALGQKQSDKRDAVSESIKKSSDGTGSFKMFPDGNVYTAGNRRSYDNNRRYSPQDRNADYGSDYASASRPAISGPNFANLAIFGFFLFLFFLIVPVVIRMQITKPQVIEVKTVLPESSKQDADAQEKSVKTVKPAVRFIPVKPAAAQESSYKLTGIMISPGKIPLAVINNQIVKEGEVLGKLKIVKINNESVDILNNGSPQTLSLRSIQDV